MKFVTSLLAQDARVGLIFAYYIYIYVYIHIWLLVDEVYYVITNVIHIEIIHIYVLPIYIYIYIYVFPLVDEVCYVITKCTRRSHLNQSIHIHTFTYIYIRVATSEWGIFCHHKMHASGSHIYICICILFSPIRRWCFWQPDADISWGCQNPHRLMGEKRICIYIYKEYSHLDMYIYIRNTCTSSNTRIRPINTYLYTYIYTYTFIATSAWGFKRHEEMHASGSCVYVFLFFSSRLVDEVFYVLKKCTRRALVTSSLNVMGDVIMYAHTLLVTTYKDALHSMLAARYMNICICSHMCVYIYMYTYTYI